MRDKILVLLAWISAVILLCMTVRPAYSQTSGAATTATSASIAHSGKKVHTPAGDMPEECVHKVSSGSRILEDGLTVIHPDKTQERFSPCFGPKPTPHAAAPNGWLELGAGPAGPNHHYSYLSGDWQVPQTPPDPGAGQTVYLFNGIESAAYIIQPVLAFYGHWYMASWYCGPVCAYSTPTDVNPGDHLTGTMSLDGSGNWTITTLDNTTGNSTVMTVSSATVGTMIWTQGGVMEVYDLGNCAEYPGSSPITFNNTTDVNNGVSETSTFSPAVYSHSDFCGENVTTAPGAASLYISTFTVGTIPPVVTSASVNGTVGSAFRYQIVATNYPSSYSASGLPPGLSVNGSGVISGTPTTAGTYSVTISATNPYGTGTGTLTITIAGGGGSPPSITSATSASGTVGTAFSYNITATNSPTSYNATGLPAGLSVNTGNGVISGTPTSTGTSSVTISAKNSSGTGSATLTLTITVPPPVINSATSASGTVGTAFSYNITATNSPTSYNATSLPAGLSLNTGNGLISGTPTSSGSFGVTISATNAGGTGTATLTLTISGSGGAPSITSATSASGAVGIAFSYQITATNSPTSYNATGLPSGLSVNTGNGLISGTPTAVGSFSVAITAANSSGTGGTTLTLTISGRAPSITSASSASGTVGSAFSYQITATNSPTSYNAIGLPFGLSVNTGNGLISGTPTAVGSFSVTITAANSGGTGSASLTLTINNSSGTPPASTTPGLRAALVYPNPVIGPNNPVVRVCPGVVDSINVTIYDIAGHVVNSSSQFSGPFIPVSGAGSGEYCYEYTWTGHIPSGVYFAVVHAGNGGSGGQVKAKIKFAVVR